MCQKEQKRSEEFLLNLPTIDMKSYRLSLQLLETDKTTYLPINLTTRSSNYCYEDYPFPAELQITMRYAPMGMAVLLFPSCGTVP